METEDGNEDVCGACTEVGDLICCESCPAAYHAECAGYGETLALHTTSQTMDKLQATLCACSESSGSPRRRLVLLVLLHPTQTQLSLPNYEGKGKTYSTASDHSHWL